jgi:hypothetical protein
MRDAAGAGLGCRQEPLRVVLPARRLAGACPVATLAAAPDGPADAAGEGADGVAVEAFCDDEV